MRVRWTQPFLEQLESARLYILAENPTAAGLVIQRILECIERLQVFPNLGRVHPERPGVRHAPVPNTPFVLVYRVRDHVLELLALWHHARMWPGM